MIKKQLTSQAVEALPSVIICTVKVIKDNDFNGLNGTMTNNQRSGHYSKFENKNDALEIRMKNQLIGMIMVKKRF